MSDSCASSEGKQAYPWINPIGGLGDMLMVAGVLKEVVDRDTSRRFNLVRRSAYRSVFLKHPAIEAIGFPPPRSSILGTDYWRHRLDGAERRPYQTLARLFGLPTPIEEKLYYPGTAALDPLLERTVPWGKKNVVIAAGSDSPRKMMLPDRWEQLARQLVKDGFFVMQAGRLFDMQVRNAYSLLGLTGLGELIAVIQRSDVVITVDTLAVHAARLAGTPAIVLWGPTDPAVYGHPGQRHLQAVPFCEERDRCLSARTPHNYGKPCPFTDSRCMNRIPLEEIRAAVHETIERTSFRQAGVRK
jgi:ADP-heptose:LPS heptosyltransferase